MRAALGVIAKAAAAATVMALLAVPAQAQFFFDWGRPSPPQRVPQQQYNPFGDFFRGPARPPVQRREAPVDNSHAPSTRKADAKDDSKITTKIVVMGDGMADWLAYGLEDAFSEQPEIGIVRKHRTTSGLIHYEPRKDTEWSQVAKDIIAAEKPKYIVMMVGMNDRQSIHEQAPTPAARSKSKRDTVDPESQQPDEKLDPEELARQSADAQNAAIEAKAEEAAAAKEKREQERGRSTSGTFEFRSEEWEAAYIKRIDATIAALKGAGVPVFWVGLPAQHNSRTSGDISYLNDLYRQRADRAGIVYVDIWDGFVDEAGRYSTQGPDYEGQIRRLRSSDGVYFTKAGARKLAHYVEREIQRSMTNRAVPVALPLEPAIPAPGNRAGGTARPIAGPVVPLTVLSGGGNDLLGGGRAQRTPAADPTASRVLIKGEPLPAETGRADDFSWPRGSKATATSAPSVSPATAAAPEAAPAPDDKKRAAQPQHSAAPRAQKSKAETEARNDDAPPPAPARKKAVRRSQPSGPPRPPMSINPGSWFR